MMPRPLFIALLLAAGLASRTLAAPQPAADARRLRVSFVTNTGAAEPGDTTFYTVGQEQFGVGRLASLVDIGGEQVTFEVLVALEYIDGSGPFTGFLSLYWPNGDAVACRYAGVVVRDAAGDSRWHSVLHVIDGRGSLTGATGVGTVSGFRSAALGGSVEYTVDLTIQRHTNLAKDLTILPKQGASREIALARMQEALSKARAPQRASAAVATKE